MTVENTTTIAPDIAPEILQAPDIFNKETDPRVEVLKRAFDKHKLSSRIGDRKIVPSELSYYLFTGITNTSGEKYSDVLLVSEHTEIKGARLTTAAQSPDSRYDKLNVVCLGEETEDHSLVEVDILFDSSYGEKEPFFAGHTDGYANYSWSGPTMVQINAINNNGDIVINKRERLPGQTAVVLVDFRMENPIDGAVSDFILTADTCQQV